MTHKKARALNAGYPLDSLLISLVRAGWGDLASRRYSGWRAVITGLVGLLPHKSGAGRVTAYQLADASSLSERWCRQIIGEMEEAGIILWVRGSIVQGKAVPSFIRLNKKRLVELVKSGRARLVEVLEARRKQFRARLFGLRKITQPRFSRLKHAELNTSPYSLSSEYKLAHSRDRDIGIDNNRFEGVSLAVYECKKRIEPSAPNIVLDEVEAIKKNSGLPSWIRAGLREGKTPMQVLLDMAKLDSANHQQEDN